MAGQQTLDLRVGVRVPIPQPSTKSDSRCDCRFFHRTMILNLRCTSVSAILTCTSICHSPAMLDFALVDELPDYDSQLLVAKGLDAAGSHDALAAARDVLAGFVHLDDPAAVEQALRELADARGLSHGQLFGILRIAISGKKVTPPLFASMQALGKETTLARIDAALGKLAAL